MIWVIFWNLANGILLFAVLIATSVEPVLFARWSPAYFIGVVISLLIVTLIGVFTFVGPTRTRAVRGAGRLECIVHRHQRWLLPTVMLAVLAGGVLVWSLPAEFTLVEALILFNVVVGAGAFVSLPNIGTYSVERLHERILWVLLALLLVVAFFSAHSVPEEQRGGDEAAWTDAAVNLLESGKAYWSLTAYKPTVLLPGTGWWLLPYAAWLDVAGISLSAGRLFMWFLYLLVVGSIGALGARLYDRLTGLVAAVVAAASVFLLFFRFVRPEIGLAVISALLVLCYLASRRRPVWALVGGWLGFVSMEFHAAGIALVVAFALMVAFDAVVAVRARRQPPVRVLLALAAGWVLGATGYALLHILILPDPSVFFTVLRRHRSFLDQWSPIVPFAVLTRVGIQIWKISPAEFALTAVALIGLLVRESPYNRILLRFFGFVLVAYAVLVPPVETVGGYMVLFMPILALGIASFLAYGFRRPELVAKPVVTIVALSLFCVPFFATALPEARWLDPMPPTAETELSRRVRALSTPDEVIVGDAFNYWALQDYREYYSAGAEYEQTAHPYDYANADELWATLKPDLVFHVYSPGNGAIAAGLERYLTQESFQLVDSFESQGYPVEIYRRPPVPELP